MKIEQQDKFFEEEQQDNDHFWNEHPALSGNMLKLDESNISEDYVFPFPAIDNLATVELELVNIF